MAFCGAIALTKSPPFGAYRQEKVHPNWPSPSGILSGDGFINIWFLAKPNGGAQTKKKLAKKKLPRQILPPQLRPFLMYIFFLTSRNKILIHLIKRWTPSWDYKS